MEIAFNDDNVTNNETNSEMSFLLACIFATVSFDLCSLMI